MFPVRMILCQIDYGTRRSESEIKDLFAEDAYRLGNGIYRSVMTMTAGPVGTGTFYQYCFNPKTALQLGLLVEYGEECHHGFAVVIVRDPMKSYLLPTPLAFGEQGDWLDAVPPPSTYPLNATAREDDFEWQTQLVEDWNHTKDHIEALELENRMLRARLRDLE